MLPCRTYRRVQARLSLSRAVASPSLPTSTPPPYSCDRDSATRVSPVCPGCPWLSDPQGIPTASTLPLCLTALLNDRAVSDRDKLATARRCVCYDTCVLIATVKTHVWGTRCLVRVEWSATRCVLAVGACSSNSGGHGGRLPSGLPHAMRRS